MSSESSDNSLPIKEVPAYQSYGLFDMEQTPKKWRRPKAVENSASPIVRDDGTDGWLGGSWGGDETPKRWSRPKPVDNSASTIVRDDGTDGWLGGNWGGDESHYHRNQAPAQIKIEGYTSSIKNNPFLKNNRR